MLREIPEDMVNQPEGNVRRRIFIEDKPHYFDLYVWYYENESEPFGFQLCYGNNSYALTWKREKGFNHDYIVQDRGGEWGRWARFNMLTVDGPAPFLRLSQQFRDATRNIDSAVSQFVLDRLNHPEKYSEKKI